MQNAKRPAEMLRLNLQKLLFDQQTQQWLLRAVADDLDNLSGVPLTDWLGNAIEEGTGGRRKPIQWSLPDVISADRREPRNADVDMGEISAKLRQTAKTGGGLECTFLVLLCFLLCDNLMNYTAAGSPGQLCEAYFTGFEQRMVEGLCGRMGYSNDRSGRVLVPAKPPCEIAIIELQLATSLITAHNARGSLHARP